MRIEQIEESFNIDVGAPIPTILSTEHELYLIFYVCDVDPDWDGTTTQMRDPGDAGIVTVKFKHFAQFKFGSPNDEAMNGHPLYKLGLRSYAIQQVIDSDWIDELRKMNSVHPYHRDESFDTYRHFIFFFHDTCFEVISEGYAIEENCAVNMKAEINRIAKLL